MNSLVRVEDQSAAVPVSDSIAISEGLVGTMDFGWMRSAARVTEHSGLPLTWDGVVPQMPQRSMARSVQLAVKRPLDFLLALAAIVALLPLLIIVAVLVRATSKGPALFKQQREGFNGKTFEAFKFRSMRIEESDASGIAQTVKGDPRITPIGRFLRSTSIDELPQLFNVLRGDMSLVGPRPHVPGMFAGGTSYRKLVPYYDARLAMRPGITGWAQANGYRGMTDDARSARARIEHDVAYIQNFSLWLDLQILVKTIVHEFVTGSGH